MNPNDLPPDNFCEGDYVQVTGEPDPWEGSGESSEDLRAYIGHVGIVVETDITEDYKLALVRFPGIIPEVGQRNIEWEKLKFISHPEGSLPEACFE